MNLLSRKGTAIMFQILIVVLYQITRLVITYVLFREVSSMLNSLFLPWREFMCSITLMNNVIWLVTIRTLFFLNKGLPSSSPNATSTLRFLSALILRFPIVLFFSSVPIPLSFSSINNHFILSICVNSELPLLLDNQRKDPVYVGKGFHDLRL